MSKKVITIDKSLTAKDAAIMMKDANVGSIIVMDNNLGMGIVTERDIVRRIVSENKPTSAPIEEIMSSPLVAMSQDAPLEELAKLMRSRGIHRVAVTKEHLIVGIVTITDLTGACGLGPDAEISAICAEMFKRKSKASL